jgi:hypothetical protein
MKETKIELRKEHGGGEQEVAGVEKEGCYIF